MSRAVALDRLHLSLAITVVLLSTIIGCGAPESTDTEQVHAAIANLSDAARDPESFSSFFVEGSAPDESQRHRYREYYYEMETPVITGSSATAVVRMQDSTGEVLDQKEWSFSKVDAQWKIDAAPLP